MSQRLSKEIPWQVYEDFVVGPVFPTPADPDARTDGAWIAYNYNHISEVPTAVPAAVEAGHPGVIELVPLTPAGDAAQRIALRAGQLAQLKDWGRFGITVKTEANASSRGYYLGLASEQGTENEVVFFYNYPPIGQSHTTIIPGIDLGGEYVELGNTAWHYDTTLAIPNDPSLTDWHTLELEVDYPNRLITFYVNGEKRGSVLVAEAHWELEVRPFVDLRTNTTEKLLIDEMAFSTADFLSAKRSPDATTEDEVKTLRPGTVRTFNK